MKGRKNKGFMHPCIHAPSSHHTIHIYQDFKGPQGQVFTWAYSFSFSNGIHVFVYA